MVISSFCCFCIKDINDIEVDRILNVISSAGVFHDWLSSTETYPDMRLMNLQVIDNDSRTLDIEMPPIVPHHAVILAVKSVVIQTVYHKVKQQYRLK